ncbi:MAG: hypothetical protein DMD43_08750, partial [Gemmatimonadetes bacterium]
MSITSSPTSPGTNRSVTWSFGVDQPATETCSLARGATVLSGPAGCSGSASYDLTGQPDGAYSFTVRATSTSGADLGSATGTYTLDTAPSVGPPTAASPTTTSTVAPTTTSTTFPATQVGGRGSTARVFTMAGGPPPPDITSAPPSPGKDPAPSWAFTTPPGTTTTCSLSYGGSPVYGDAPCGGTQSYDLTGKPDGDYVFSVFATDGVGGTSSTATSTYTYDTTKPVPPTITAAPASPGNTLSPSWSFSPEAGTTNTCELTSGGSPVSGPAPCAGGAGYDLTGKPDGTYTFSVFSTDQAGNVGDPATSSYVLDTQPPGPATITAQPASPGNGTHPVWSFTLPPSTTGLCSLSIGATVVYPQASCSSPVTYDLTGKADGTYVITVYARDAAGNVSTPVTGSYVFDRTPPAAPAITAAPATPGNGRSPAWSFTGEAGATLTCSLTRGGTTISPAATCTSPKSFDLTGQPDGTYTFSVTATDAAGNVSPAATGTYTLDTVPPAAPTITSTPGPTGNDLSPTWTFTAESGATTTCSLSSGATVVYAASPCSGSVSYDLRTKPDAAYTLTVVATDAAGNVGPAATSTYVLDT